MSKFEAAFLLPDQQTDMVLSIGSNAAGFTKIIIPLSYTPVAAESTVHTGPSPSSKPEPPVEPLPSVSPSPEPSQMPETGMKTGYQSCAKDSACVMAAYSDLDRSSWYHNGVHFALENGIMNGVREEVFNPNSPTSRAMIVTMLYRLEGEPKSEDAVTFKDVPSDTWYTEAVRWAASEHIVDGYSEERFAPNDNVTREQLATILWRYAKYKGTDKIPASEINLGIYIVTTANSKSRGILAF